MPIDRRLYPPDWEAISQAVKDAAGWRCEGSPAFPRSASPTRSRGLSWF